MPYDPCASEALWSLLELARRLLQADPTAEQVIVVKTAERSVRYFFNHSAGDTVEEDAFLKMLQETGDMELRLCLCMWHSGEMDVPSHHFRRRLLKLCPQNARTCIPLQGEGVYHMKKLEATMPSARQPGPPV